VFEPTLWLLQSSGRPEHARSRSPDESGPDRGELLEGVSQLAVVDVNARGNESQKNSVFELFCRNPFTGFEAGGDSTRIRFCIEARSVFHFAPFREMGSTLHPQR
jgi:hypothetical protein